MLTLSTISNLLLANGQPVLPVGNMRREERAALTSVAGCFAQFLLMLP